MVQTILLSILVFLGGCAAQAQGLAVRNSHVQAQLVSQVQSIQPGTDFWVAVVMTMDPDWHIYWKNPGDSGLPLEIRWDLPDGFQAEALQWPYPHKFDQPPLASYGYEGTVFLLTKIHVPAQLVPGPQTLRAQLKWLVCAAQCIPGRANLQLQVPVSDHPPQLNHAVSKNFARTRADLPVQTHRWKIAAQDNGQTLTLQLTAAQQEPDLSSVYFFPERGDIINHAAPQTLRKTPQGWELDIPRSSLSSGPLSQVKGVLVSSNGWGPRGERALALDLKIGPPPAPVKPDDVNRQLFLMLLFAFVGGMVLNLMPCVLPIVSLKIFNFIQHSKKGTPQLLAHGLVFTGGILVSFWVLNSLLLLLRAGGHQVGWGFQFQSPAFLVFLSLVFFTLALNLFGLFEVPALIAILPPKRKTEWINVFISGCLATLSATPCTAPFMGTALGFSLSQPPLVSFLVFTFLGLGMAFPYIMLCAFPPLLRFVPKPGPWMVHFKRFLGLLLLATVAWLLWILWAQVGPLSKTVSDPTAVSERGGIQWMPFSQKLVDRLRAEKRIVFIDFTARWCLTCQVNERVALNNPAVVAKFKELNVAAVKADWTLQDAYIAKILASYGKNAIPLYVLYGKNTEPMILPEIITPKIVLDALEKVE